MRNAMMVAMVVSVLVGCGGDAIEGERFAVESGKMTGSCAGIPRLATATLDADGTGVVETEEGEELATRWTDAYGFRTIDLTAHDLSGLVLSSDGETWTDDRWVIPTSHGECVIESVSLTLL